MFKMKIQQSKEEKKSVRLPYISDVVQQLSECFNLPVTKENQFLFYYAASAALLTEMAHPADCLCTGPEYEFRWVEIDGVKKRQLFYSATGKPV